MPRIYLMARMVVIRDAFSFERRNVAAVVGGQISEDVDEMLNCYSFVADQVVDLVVVAVG